MVVGRVSVGDSDVDADAVLRNSPPVRRRLQDLTICRPTRTAVFR